MFCTDNVWTALAETGKFKTQIDFIQVNEFREQLYAEARDEEVSLCISTSRMPTARPIVYVSLRKNKMT